MGDAHDRREVYLVFEASGCSAMTVWLNGLQVGYSEDSKAPAEFKVSAFLRKGTNVLAVEVRDSAPHTECTAALLPRGVSAVALSSSPSAASGTLPSGMLLRSPL